MLKHLPTVSQGFAVISAMTLCTLAMAPSASAFDFKPTTGRVGVTSADVGQKFKVAFDGNVSTQNVLGLSSEAIFEFLGFTTIGTGANTKTEAAFEITLDNTSSGSITSRTSALGLNVYNYDGTHTGSSLPLLGVGNDNGPNVSGRTRSTGIFTEDATGHFPNQFGDVDVCFKNGGGPNCAGAGSGGVSTPDTPGKFKTTLAFNGSVTKFALGNFGVRYQSIEGTNLGTSGTGKGTATKIKKPRDPNKIPEPGTVGAILLTGFGILTSARKRQQGDQESQAAV